MSQVLVVVFEGEEDASQARQGIRELQKAGRISLQDAAVVVKDADGKVSTRGEVDSSVKSGALWGGVLGLLLAFLFPIAGLAVGVIGGAIVGKMLDQNVDKNFIRDVQNALHPSSSALFLIIRDGDPTALVAELKPYKGTIFHTSLSTQLEDSLQNVLKD